MKADPADQNALLDVQSHDTLIAQLMHRKAALPELEKLAELQRARAELDSTRVATGTEVSDLEIEQRKADAEVEQVKSRRARDEERLNSGTITNPKDLESLQHEMTALQRRITTLEDEELEVMEKLESAQQRLAKVSADLGDLDAEIIQYEAARDSQTAQIDTELAAAQADRNDARAQVGDDLLGLYDKLVESKQGVGAAALRQRACQGCRLELNGADLRDIAGQARDDVVRCPECGRILVRTPESGI